MQRFKRREDFFVRKVREHILSIDENGHVYREYDEFRRKVVHKRIDRMSGWRYRTVKYVKDRVTHVCFAHRLVYACHYPIPDGMVINHKDGNKTNNRISNLEAVTPSQNTLHSIYVLGNKRLYGSQHPRAKLTPQDIDRIFDLRARGFSYLKIARTFGISKSQTGRILRGKSWKIRE